MDNRRNNKFYEEEVKTDFKFIFIRSYSHNTDSFSKALSLIYIYLSHQDTVLTLLAQIEKSRHSYSDRWWRVLEASQDGHFWLSSPRSTGGKTDITITWFYFLADKCFFKIQHIPALKNDWDTFHAIKYKVFVLIATFSPMQLPNHSARLTTASTSSNRWGIICQMYGIYFYPSQFDFFTGQEQPKSRPWKAEVKI